MTNTSVNNTNNPEIVLPDSLWQATAVAAVNYPRLDQAIEADVTIIGAGFTGLSAALHLSELGYRVCLLEAVAIGFGASGRNGGQVIQLVSGFKGLLDRWER